jgi:hypothetical protein
MINEANQILLEIYINQIYNQGIQLHISRGNFVQAHDLILRKSLALYEITKQHEQTTLQTN